MSEKRFILDSDFVKVTSEVVWDNQEEKGLTLMKLVNLLNKQQSDLVYLARFIGEVKVEEFKLKLRNLRILEDKVLEQQSIIEHLKERLYDFEKRKIIEESEIGEDVIPKVKMLRTELFGEKYE